MTAKLLGGLLVSALAVTVAAQAEAKNLLDPAHGMPKAYMERIIKAQNGLLEIDSSEQAKGMYATFHQWPANFPKLRVCFMGGSNEVRNAIVTLARDWHRADVGIRFDFGKKGKPRSCDATDDKTEQVRISFDKPGFWGVFGQWAETVVPQEEASLNLEGYDKLSAADIMSGYNAGTVRHEFGHLLGLQHEHQSPNSACAADFDWDAINKELSGPPNSWDQPMIDHNMRPVEGDRLNDTMVTKFDPKSVMLYVFGSQFFRNGEQSACYVGQPNNDISELDFATVAFMYPAKAGSRMEATAASRTALQAMLDKSAADGKKTAGIDYMQLLFGAKGTVDIPDEE